MLKWELAGKPETCPGTGQVEVQVHREYRCRYMYMCRYMYRCI